MVFRLSRRLDHIESNFHSFHDSGVFSELESIVAGLSQDEFPKPVRRKGRKKTSTSGMLGRDDHAKDKQKINGEGSATNHAQPAIFSDLNAGQSYIAQREGTKAKSSDDGPVQRSLLRAPSMDLDAGFIEIYGGSDSSDTKESVSEESGPSETASQAQTVPLEGESIVKKTQSRTEGEGPNARMDVDTPLSSNECQQGIASNTLESQGSSRRKKSTSPRENQESSSNRQESGGREKKMKSKALSAGRSRPKSSESQSTHGKVDTNKSATKDSTVRCTAPARSEIPASSNGDGVGEASKRRKLEEENPMTSADGRTREREHTHRSEDSVRSEGHSEVRTWVRTKHSESKGPSRKSKPKSVCDAQGGPSDGIDARGVSSHSRSKMRSQARADGTSTRGREKTRTRKSTSSSEKTTLSTHSRKVRDSTSSESLPSSTKSASKREAEQSTEQEQKSTVHGRHRPSLRSSSCTRRSMPSKEAALGSSTNADCTGEKKEHSERTRAESVHDRSRTSSQPETCKQTSKHRSGSTEETEPLDRISSHPRSRRSPSKVRRRNSSRLVSSVEPDDCREGSLSNDTIRHETRQNSIRNGAPTIQGKDTIKHTRNSSPVLVTSTTGSPRNMSPVDAGQREWSLSPQRDVMEECSRSQSSFSLSPKKIRPTLMQLFSQTKSPKASGDSQSVLYQANDGMDRSFHSVPAMGNRSPNKVWQRPPVSPLRTSRFLTNDALAYSSPHDKQQIRAPLFELPDSGERKGNKSALDRPGQAKSNLLSGSTHSRSTGVGNRLRYVEKEDPADSRRQAGSMAQSMHVGRPPLQKPGPEPAYCSPSREKPKLQLDPSEKMEVSSTWSSFRTFGLFKGFRQDSPSRKEGSENACSSPVKIAEVSEIQRCEASPGNTNRTGLSDERGRSYTVDTVDSPTHSEGGIEYAMESHVPKKRVGMSAMRSTEEVDDTNSDSYERTQDSLRSVDSKTLRTIAQQRRLSKSQHNSPVKRRSSTGENVKRPALAPLPLLDDAGSVVNVDDAVPKIEKQLSRMEHSSPSKRWLGAIGGSFRQTARSHAYGDDMENVQISQVETESNEVEVADAVPVRARVRQVTVRELKMELSKDKEGKQSELGDVARHKSQKPRRRIAEQVSKLMSKKSSSTS
jgi:hypothetical protein